MCCRFSIFILRCIFYLHKLAFRNSITEKLLIRAKLFRFFLSLSHGGLEHQCLFVLKRVESKLLVKVLQQAANQIKQMICSYMAWLTFYPSTILTSRKFQFYRPVSYETNITTYYDPCLINPDIFRYRSYNDLNVWYKEIYRPAV